MRFSARRAQQGFSLLELLVAFTIMAFSLAMLYQASGSSIRNVGETDQAQRAAVLAESLLSMQDAIPESGWNADGQSDGMSWHVRSQPYPTDVSTAVLAVPVLHEVSILVEWPGRVSAHQLQLSTLLPQKRPLPGAPIR